MQNKLIDLHNHLFEQLERLSDEELDLETEIKRTKAITDVSQSIINNATLVLNAQKYFNDLDFSQSSTPKIFLTENKTAEQKDGNIQQRDSGIYKE